MDDASAAPAARTDDPVILVREVIDAVNDRSIVERASELLAPGFVRHDLVDVMGDTLGPDGSQDFVSHIVAAMPDFHLDVLDAFGSGDRVALRLRMTGTHTGADMLGAPATGARLDAAAMFIYRVEDGLIAEGWQMTDGLAFHALAERLKPAVTAAMLPSSTVDAADRIRAWIHSEPPPPLEPGRWRDREV